MPPPSISAIIPTWNEAPWLPSVLARLESQPAITEIIVADNDSEDDTAAIARSRGCAVVRGGRPGVGRNAGAEAAHGEVLLFLDADVGIAAVNIEHIQERFSESACNLVYFRLAPQALKRKLWIRQSYFFLDSVARIASRFNRPGLSAPLIAVRAEVFRELNGFDEAVTAAEDAEFIGRVARLKGGVEYARTPTLAISARRLFIEGPLYQTKALLWTALRLSGSKASGPGYRWKQYPARVAANDPIIDRTVDGSS